MFTKRHVQPYERANHPSRPVLVDLILSGIHETRYEQNAFITLRWIMRTNAHTSYAALRTSRDQCVSL
jgi:hypothetical protein